MYISDKRAHKGHIGRRAVREADGDTTARSGPARHRDLEPIGVDARPGEGAPAGRIRVGGDGRLAGGLPRRVGEKQLVTGDETDLDDDEEEEREHREGEHELDGCLPALPAPRHQLFTIRMSESKMASSSLPT